MEIGKVYVQTFGHGELTYFKPVKKNKNGSFNGIGMPNYGRGKNRPVQFNGILQYGEWMEVLPAAVPAALK